MMDPVREVKVRAELLHRRARALEPDALERLRFLPELRRASAEALRAAARHIQRKHCLAAVARGLGFSSWEHALRVLGGDPSEHDFGKLLYGAEWGARLNQWFASYEEARASLEASQGIEPRRYLLAFQRHFFLVEGPFIEELGLDPDDPDWEAIGWNWARPRSAPARRRLYAKLLAASSARGAR